MKKIKSVCPKCNKWIEAKIIYQKNKVFMIKKCPIHGNFKNLIDSDKSFYKSTQNQENKKLRHSRLEIPVTYNCNLKCSFCYAPNNKKKDLSIKEISKIIDKFDGDYISISGGEPTLRNDLPQIIKLIINKNKIPILNTNGIRLADENYVKILKKAGLRLIHFSFNGFKNDPFINQNVKNIIKLKQKALKNIINEKILIILSLLLLKGENESELKPIIKYALKNDKSIFELRIRSANMIGRYKNTTVYTTSEILNLVCKTLNINKKHLINKLKQIKKGKCSCKFSGTFYFMNKISKFLDVKLYPRTGKENLFSFISKYGNIFLIDLIKKLNLNQMYYYYSFFQINNKAKKNILKAIIGHKKIKALRIEIRSWPNKYNVNLNETSNCPSLGLSKNKKELLPFCYRFFTEKKFKNKEVSLCKY